MLKNGNARPMAGTRIDRSLKEQIDKEAARFEREPAWLYRKLITLGWQAYQRELQRKSKTARAS
jgi:hypothetical protein